MKASVRCNSLTLDGPGNKTLVAMELHGKRLDKSSLGRVIRDRLPLVYGSLDLRATYDRHMAEVKQNAGVKRPVLHFLIRFPPEILGDDPPGPYAGRSVDERKMIMAGQAVDFINATHGGNAVFAARVDRDEVGETIVDIFASPIYEKVTKRKTERWASPTKFGKDLCEKHRNEIERRNNGRFATGPRHVGISLQAEFAQFFERVNGAPLVSRVPKDARPPDRLEIEAWKAIAEREAELQKKEAEVVAIHAEAMAMRNRLAALLNRVRAWLDRSDLTQVARVDADAIMRDAGPDLVRPDGQGGGRSMSEIRSLGRESAPRPPAPDLGPDLGDDDLGLG